MSLSNSSRNVTAPVYRDTVQTAVLKNVVTVVLCISINYVNGTLVHTYKRHQVFNTNPRYILYIHLVINDMILLTIFTLLQVLSYIVFTLNVSLCTFLLTTAVLANLNNPLTLAAMAVECYVAVCLPLHHARVCTVRRTHVAISTMWALSALSILPDVLVAVATEPADFFSSRVFCLRETIFRSPALTQKRDASNTAWLLIVWLTLLYTYFKILFTAKAAAADAKKARNTVLLHGFQLCLCMLTYVYGPILEGLIYLFPKEALAIRFVISILVQILPRLISPVVYGLRDKTFRKYLQMYLFCTSNNIHPQKISKEQMFM